MKLYVGNLPYTAGEDAVREMFAEFGQITSVQMITDKFSGQSKGFGFVEMPNSGEADAAIKGLNGRQISGRSIKVSQAKPRDSKPRDNNRQQRRPRY